MAEAMLMILNLVYAILADGLVPCLQEASSVKEFPHTVP